MEESIPPSSCDSPISTSLINGHARRNGLASTIDRIIQQHVYVFSANDRESLERQISKITVYVKERPVILHTDMLDSLAFTLGQRRSVLPWKLAFSAPTPDALIRSLTDPFLALTKSSDQPRIGFLFTGQGSQWANMGRELFRAYPVYASAIRKADDVLRSLGASWSLIIEMGKAEEVSNIDRPYISQPACTALQIALVDLLRSWGVRSCKVVVTRVARLLQPTPQGFWIWKSAWL
jgi:acyl transferase domain-containing protein